MPAADGELENWLHDLTDGEATARQFRHRQADTEERAEACCPACDGAATGKFYFGLGGQLRGRRSA
ncbi:hypothetical protein DMO24_01730 [Modestobacter versicolor]|uniref:Uncharacterized protein n=1 Tax=Modestobacter versicolor TaxID=429133 RepID=A0A323VGF6_9ACTN|nr:hypothetical protein DMO24_01730 [Modestobacter versicolor]